MPRRDATIGLVTGFDLGEFGRAGVVALRGAFTRDEADAMKAAIWRRVESQTTARRDDPSTWCDVALPSFKPLKRRGVFAPAIHNAELAGALDGIFGRGAWAPSGSGVQVLMTFPNATSWTLPHHLWHTDAGFGRVTPTTMVKVFCCVDDVRQGRGGTLALAGSHRLVDRDAREGSEGPRPGNSAAWRRFLSRDGWTRDLINPGAEPARSRRLLGEPAEIDGIEVGVVEMTGAPGDVFVTDIHTFHCVAPNALDRPRMMLGVVFSRAEA